MLAGKAADAAKRASTPDVAAGPPPAPALFEEDVGCSCLLILVQSGSGSKQVSLTAAGASHSSHWGVSQQFGGGGAKKAAQEGRGSSAVRGEVLEWGGVGGGWSGTTAAVSKEALPGCTAGGTSGGHFRNAGWL